MAIQQSVSELDTVLQDQERQIQYLRDIFIIIRIREEGRYRSAHPIHHAEEIIIRGIDLVVSDNFLHHFQESVYFQNSASSDRPISFVCKYGIEYHEGFIDAEIRTSRSCILRERAGEISPREKSNWEHEEANFETERRESTYKFRSISLKVEF